MQQHHAEPAHHGNKQQESRITVIQPMYVHVCLQPLQSYDTSKKGGFGAAKPRVSLLGQMRNAPKYTQTYKATGIGGRDPKLR
jgi:hypothetical protein